MFKAESPYFLAGYMYPPQDVHSLVTPEKFQTRDGGMPTCQAINGQTTVIFYIKKNHQP
jgi:hypothetical protein